MPHDDKSSAIGQTCLGEFVRHESFDRGIERRARSALRRIEIAQPRELTKLDLVDPNFNDDISAPTPIAKSRHSFCRCQLCHDRER
jgi:hypothetical protein